MQKFSRLLVLTAAAVIQLSAPPTMAAGSCGSDIQDVGPLLRAGMTVLFGEIHGTVEVPRFVGDVACRGARANLPVVVALEADRVDEPAFARYLASKGGATARAQLLDSDFWRTPYPDGRSSQAMADLLERMRRLRADGADVMVLGLVESSPYRNSDQVMGERLLALRNQHPRALILVLAGNNHTRIGPWLEGPSSRAMGEVLRESGMPDFVSLGVSTAGGTFFGISGKPGIHQIEGDDRGPRRFVRLTRQHGPFDGKFYVGRITPSPPAVSAARRLAP